MLLVCHPKRIFVGKPLQEVLDQLLIVEVEVELEDVDHKDDVELVVDG